MELGRERLEVCIFSELSLSLQEMPLRLSLQEDLGGAEWAGLRDEVILVDGFCIGEGLPYWREKSGFSSSFSTFFTFLAKYSGLGLL